MCLLTHHVVQATTFNFSTFVHIVANTLHDTTLQELSHGAYRQNSVSIIIIINE